jgi:hypothetical protein
MNRQYQHTQIGYLIIAFFAITLLLLSLLMAIYGFNWIGFAVMIICVLCLMLFVTLTIWVDSDFIEIRFGIGIIRKKFPLKDIATYHLVKNPWYYGWGVHITPNGWLYNVSGSSALEITMKSGKKYRIGTDVPNELEQSIRQTVGVVAG